MQVQAEGKLLWEDCVWIGMERNGSLGLEQVRSEIFPILTRDKWKQYLPKLGVHYFGIFSKNQEQIDQEYRDVRLQIQQLLYDGGETEREKQKIELKRLIHSEEKKLLKEKIFKSISLSYLNYNKRQLVDTIYQLRSDRYQLENQKRKKESELGLFPKAELGFWKVWEVEFQSKKIHSESARKLAFLELKQSMSLDSEMSLLLEGGLTERIVLFDPKEIQTAANENHPLRKKSRLQMDLAELDQESLENDWKPKLVLGGYIGKNGNAGFPLQNEIYGLSLGVQANLGGTSFQSNTQNGIQSEGNGIQRIPGYGPQPVGPGENAFQSGSIGLFDDLGRNKKVFDSKMSVLQAKSDWKQTEIVFSNQIQSTEIKLFEMYRKYILYLENCKSGLYQHLVKREEQKENLISELEYLKSEEEVFVGLETLLDHYFQYITTALELVLLLGENPFDNRYYRLETKRTSSDITKILEEWKDKTSKKNPKINEPKLKKPYPFLMEESYESR
ncbi:channel protein TolC [Leptospira congkakensis]|uniref:Channel protein TolC n=2 Tax=Leptospira congkakensis TaxID=2484932 RepID=A0A4Z1A990_9LEPT|nr:channel protein TolC [Leptospira congkakensis]TGL87973.1 channel protein TolC [Leptospira congkakensis]TGL92732.1 channel protein TolC [Leptospira congkakensis]TGL96131.1 channel protein TolC [Leptospira congkakensis]